MINVGFHGEKASELASYIENLRSLKSSCDLAASTIEACGKNNFTKSIKLKYEEAAQNLSDAIATLNDVPSTITSLANRYYEEDVAALKSEAQGIKWSLESQEIDVSSGYYYGGYYLTAYGFYYEGEYYNYY